jgi:uncharacterized protein
VRKGTPIHLSADQFYFRTDRLNLEFLLRMKSEWRKELKAILFTKGDIVEAGEKAEKLAD